MLHKAIISVCKIIPWIIAKRVEQCLLIVVCNCVIAGNTNSGGGALHTRGVRTYIQRILISSSVPVCASNISGDKTQNNKKHVS